MILMLECGLTLLELHQRTIKYLMICSARTIIFILLDLLLVGLLMLVWAFSQLAVVAFIIILKFLATQLFVGREEFGLFMQTEQDITGLLRIT